jgi:hypothetical protein
MLSKEVTKSLLKKSQKTVTVTHICRLFTDKSCIKVLQKASQSTRHKIVTTGQSSLFSVTVTKCGTWGVIARKAVAILNCSAIRL